MTDVIPRETKSLAGRHADPVDQAEAILWHAHIRNCADLLIGALDEFDPGEVVTDPEAAQLWIAAARRIFLDVISHD